MLKISESIKTLRLKSNYTQEKLADICGVSRQAVAKWESGANLPDIEKLCQIAKLFNTTVDALLNGETVTKHEQNQDQDQNSGSQSNDFTQNEKIVNQALQKAMSCGEPDEEIFQFISYIGKQIGCDRTYIFEQNPDGSYKNTYEWCSRGIEPQIEYLQNIPLEDMSLWLSIFSQGKHVFIKDVDAIANSEPQAYRWLKPQGINSLLACPLFGGRCFLGADNPAPAFITQTHSLLEIMARFTETMLQRRDLVHELKFAVFQNDQFSRSTRGISYRINVVTGHVQIDQEMEQELGYSFKADNVSQLNEFLNSHPEFHDHLVIDGIQRAIETKENLSVEFISYRKDRTVRWNRISICPFLDSKGTVLYLYGILQDISDEHQIVEQYNRYISRLSGGLHICYLSRPIHLEYASDDLCAFLGYSRDEFETLVGTKYTNVIVEEDRAAFSGYAERLALAPKIESCEYRLRRKDGSIVQVIETMESIADSNGIMYGYAYILEKTQMQAMLEMAKDTEKKHLTLINRQYEVMEALGKDYLNVFRVWLDEDKAQIVKLNGYVTKGMNRQSAEYIPYYRFCKQYVQDRVYSEDQQKMLNVMHPDNVRKVLSEEEEYLVVYRIMENGEIHFYQLKYVKLDSADKKTVNFIAGFKNVDKVVEEEHNRNSQLQQRVDIINAILRSFTCGYYYQYQDDSFIELANSNKGLSKIVGKKGNFTENRKRMEILFPDKNAFRLIDEFLNPATVEARLEGRKIMSDRVLVSGSGWYELYIFVVDYDDNGKLSHFVLAAKDISDEKQKEEEYFRSLGIANNRARAAMHYAYMDSLTGVMNRNAYERDLQEIDKYDKVGIIFCDVNRLKTVNDTEGHESGDVRLKNFADILKLYFSIDCIYRIGGDEFVCMIGNVKEPGFSERVDKLRQAVDECGKLASIGSSYGSTKQKNILIKEAEAEMYDIKNNQGENRK